MTRTVKDKILDAAMVILSISPLIFLILVVSYEVSSVSVESTVVDRSMFVEAVRFPAVFHNYTLSNGVMYSVNVGTGQVDYSMEIGDTVCYDTVTMKTFVLQTQWETTENIRAGGCK